MPRIEITQARCKGCGLCVEVCPEKLISVDDKMDRKGVYPVYSPHPERCTGCRLCVTVCPDAAIAILGDESDGKEEE